MTVSLRLNNDEGQIIKSYSTLNGISVSELFRRAVFERIEDEYDLKIYQRALDEHNENPITYSLDEMERELGAMAV